MRATEAVEASKSLLIQAEKDRKLRIPPTKQKPGRTPRDFGESKITSRGPFKLGPPRRTFFRWYMALPNALGTPETCQGLCERTVLHPFLRHFAPVDTRRPWPGVVRLDQPCWRADAGVHGSKVRFKLACQLPRYRIPRPVSDRQI